MDLEEYSEEALRYIAAAVEERLSNEIVTDAARASLDVEGEKYENLPLNARSTAAVKMSSHKRYFSTPLRLDVAQERRVLKMTDLLADREEGEMICDSK